VWESPVAAVDIGIGVFRIDLDRLVVVRDRLVVLALCQIRDAAVDIGLRKFRIDLDRFGFVRDRLVMLALRRIGGAAVDIGIGVFRIDLRPRRGDGGGNRAKLPCQKRSD
jgi:hypothetical protein